MSDIYISEYGQYGLGTEVLVKIGSRWPNPNDWRHYVGFRHCQVVDIAPIGTYKESGNERKNMCVIELPNIAYWNIRGSLDIKDDTEGADYLHTFVTSDETINGKTKRREWLIDIDWLYTQGYITAGQWESIYDKSRTHDRISLSFIFNLNDIIKYEPEWEREDLQTLMQPGSISAGTYTIGSGLDYATVTAFEADLAATLTGNLKGEHNNEETAITAPITFDVDTASYTLTLGVGTGDKHDGTFGSDTWASGDGARINYGTSDGLVIDETTAGTLDNFVIEDLVLDARGSLNYGIDCVDGGDSGDIIVRNCIIRGDGSGYFGIRCYSACAPIIYNNFVYGFTSGTYGAGIGEVQGATQVLNNTLKGNRIGIYVGDTTTTKVMRNNLCQGNTYGFYSLYGATYYGTTSKNLTEDATSPNASYRSINCHDGNSCFVDYANNNLLLVSTGDEITTLDDGDSQSSIFTIDILGYTRSTWYIGASELIVLITGSLDANLTTPVMDITGKQTISGSLDANLITPVMDLTGTQTISGSLDANLTAPVMDITGKQTISGSLDANLITPVMDLTGTQTVSGSLDANLTTPVMDLTGKQTISGTFNANLITPVMDLADGAGSFTGTLSGTMPNAEMSITGVVGKLGTFNANLITPTMDITGTQTISGSLSANLTTPVMDISSLLSVDIDVTAFDAYDLSAIENARVYIKADAGGILSEGTTIVNNLTDGDGNLVESFDFSGTQPVVGWVRKADTSPFYAQGVIKGTITSNGFTANIPLVPDE